MNAVWMSAAVLAGVGLVLGLVIAVVARIFFVEKDPRIDQVAELLPGANCGGCGFAGCADLAKNIVLSDVPCGKCPANSEENKRKINELLGRTGGVDCEKMVAVVLCGGSDSRTSAAAGYNGVSDCRTASIVAGGGKGCRFGCMGYGSCARACRFGAIEIIDGLAVVHADLCRGCGQCVNVCPRKLIKLVPASVKVHVYCNSLAKPAEKRRVCSAMCLACRKCIKLDETKMSSQGTLVRVNYSNPPEADIVEKAGCPTGVLCTPEEHLRQIREAAAKKAASLKKGDAK